jgi:hypothetical protein
MGQKILARVGISPLGRHPQLQFGGWQWVIEYGGMLNTYDDAEEIRDELLANRVGAMGSPKESLF